MTVTVFKPGSGGDGYHPSGHMVKIDSNGHLRVIKRAEPGQAEYDLAVYAPGAWTSAEVERAEEAR